MATVPSASGNSAAQYGMAQLTLVQARRAADQADQAAQQLQAQAQDARRAADRADDNARALAVASSQAQADASRARQGLVALQSVNQMETQLGKAASSIVTQQQQAVQAANPATASVAAAPVVNAQGQLTGQVVNTTA